MNERAIQIVCADLALLRKYRAELERSAQASQIRLALSPAEARRSSRQAEPAVILLDESAVPGAAQKGAIESAAARLIEAAPVVVVAGARRQPELKFLIASGAVDFVARSGGFVALAADKIERRRRLAGWVAAQPSPMGEPAGDFGEILRHEVNNPLTGILGNAELLLARREHLPPAAVERVETIAELAVRLRETVRRLSYAWEERQDDPQRSA
jgi:signal transduction histidine kinase